MTLKVAPSVLAADWSKLGEEVTSVVEAGAEWIHLDVMDGHFVPPITFGPGVVSAVRKSTSAFLDVHLMIERPERQLEDFARAGADLITVHYEACPHLHRVIQAIRGLGKLAGVALNPATPVSHLSEIISDVDLVLIMSVNPGWGGQTFLSGALRRVAEVKRLASERGCSVEIEVDGGVTNSNASELAQAGATVLVAGTYIFGAPNRSLAINSLMSSMQS